MNVVVILPCLNDHESLDAILPDIHYDGWKTHVTTLLGLPNAIHQSILGTDADVVVVMDSDGQQPPVYIKRLVTALQEHDADLVTASRTNWAHTLQGTISRTGNWLVCKYLHLGVRDCTSGFYAAKRSRLLELPDSVWAGYGDYFIQLLWEARQRKWGVAEISFHSCRRITGESHTRPLKHTIMYAGRALHLRRQQ